MSLYTLPFLYLNLGGEMVYILEQRLMAHKTSEQKQKKVIQDLIRRMLADGVVSSLFTAQPLPTLKRLKANFNKLANTSFVNLSEGSMDKLFDLMLTTFKYNLLMCKSGHELILLTLNHLDGLREIVQQDSTGSSLNTLVNKACTQLTECYHGFSEGQLMIARHTLLSLVQGFNRKVTLFMAKKWQLPDGEFVLSHGGKVPYGAQPPGMIRYLYGEHSVEMVTLWCNYEGMERKGCLDVTGDRTITIGQNFYHSSSPSSGKKATGKTTKSVKSIDKRKQDSSSHSAKAELDFLQHLLIGSQQSPPESSAEDFKLVLFDSPSDSTDGPTRTSGPNLTGAIKIKTKNSKGHISSVLKDFDVSEKTSHPSENEDTDLDLLSLMDNL